MSLRLLSDIIPTVFLLLLRDLAIYGRDASFVLLTVDTFTLLAVLSCDPIIVISKTLTN